MQILISFLTGKTITLEMELSVTVETVKQRVQDKEGIPPDQVHLLFGGRKMEDSHTLADYDVQNGSELHMTFRLRCTCGCDLEPGHLDRPQWSAWRLQLDQVGG